jgi:hypothetical protein
MFSGIALVAFVAHGCTGVVPLAAGHYPAQLDTGVVRVIDAREMARSGVERILNEHIVIARFDVSLPRSDDFEQRLSAEVEKGKVRTLSEGGRALMYTDNSELIGVIKQDARYAGAPDVITMYVMLRRM